MRRIAAIGAVLSLSAVGLTACGGDDKDAADKAVLDQVKITAEAGKAPVVTWDPDPVAGKGGVKVLIRGTGAALADTDTVIAKVYLSDGYDGSVKFDGYDAKQAPMLIRVDADKTSLDQLQTSGILPWLLAKQINKGTTVGTRFVLAGGPTSLPGTPDKPKQLSAAFGAIFGQMFGVGNEDPMAIVVELAGKATPAQIKEAAPLDPATAKVVDVRAGQVPRLLGGFKGFDFSKSPAVPRRALMRATLKAGNGALITRKSAVKVRYLGSVWGSAEVFDENFGKGKKPLNVATGDAGVKKGGTSVIPGWQIGLVGARVGSRIELVIPAELAYGEAGSPPKIPANATLVFIVDILSAS